MYVFLSTVFLLTDWRHEIIITNCIDGHTMKMKLKQTRRAQMCEVGMKVYRSKVFIYYHQNYAAVD